MEYLHDLSQLYGYGAVRGDGGIKRTTFTCMHIYVSPQRRHVLPRGDEGKGIFIELEKYFPCLAVTKAKNIVDN